MSDELPPAPPEPTAADRLELLNRALDEEAAAILSDAVARIEKLGRMVVPQETFLTTRAGKQLVDLRFVIARQGAV